MFTSPKLATIPILQGFWLQSNSSSIINTFQHIQTTKRVAFRTDAFLKIHLIIAL